MFGSHMAEAVISMDRSRCRFSCAWFSLLLFQALTVVMMLFCRPFIPSVHSADYSLQGRHTALSLRVLAEKAQVASNAGTPMNSELTGLSGITHLEGYVVDKENQDLVLIGRSDRGTSMHLDDLLVNIRSIWNHSMAPYCSLNPNAGDIVGIREIAAENQNPESMDEWRELIDQVKDRWGSQSVEIMGIPRDSRQAHIMIDADYHMKKVSLGLADFAGVSSYLEKNLSAMEDSLRSGEEPAGPGISMVRFWFHVRQGFPTYGEEDDIVFLEDCPMDILTEKQNADPEGMLSDSDQDDPHAVSFAREYSRMLDSSAENVESHAQLKSLFRLKAVLEAMNFRNAAAEAGLDMTNYCGGYVYQAGRPMPDSFPGLVNHKEANLKVQRQDEEYDASFIPVAWGGVHMEMQLSERRFRCDKRLKRVRKIVLDARPSGQSLSWTFTSH